MRDLIGASAWVLRGFVRDFRLLVRIYLAQRDMHRARSKREERAAQERFLELVAERMERMERAGELA